MRSALLILLGIIGAGLLGLLAAIAWWSPGEPLAESHAEKLEVEINGVKQGMFIESADANRPVLLFVHGGPGMPEYFLNERMRPGLSEDFTVCWWEQRGAGLSFDPAAPMSALTVEQLVDDTIEVSRYLTSRFGKAQIYLLGHSWGSFIAVQAAARAPELYLAYLGMAQVSDQRASERLALEYSASELEQRGDQQAAQRLRKLAIPLSGPLPEEWLSVRDEVMHRLGIGTTRSMRSVVTGIFLPVWQTRAYTLGEKINIWRGKLRSRRQLFEELVSNDMSERVPGLAIPAYFFHGRHDLTAAYSLAQSYFAKLHAPQKGFYTFDQSAHSPLFEEPAKFRKILREDVLERRNQLADSEPR